MSPTNVGVLLLICKLFLNFAIMLLSLCLHPFASQLQAGGARTVLGSKCDASDFTASNLGLWKNSAIFIQNLQFIILGIPNPKDISKDAGLQAKAAYIWSHSLKSKLAQR